MLYAWDNVANTGHPTHGASSIVGASIGLIIAFISGIASIYTEVLMKGQASFWVAQVSTSSLSELDRKRLTNPSSGYTFGVQQSPR
jgi:hypothetical protein